MESSKYLLSGGTYRSRAFKQAKKVYINIPSDDIIAYPVLKNKNGPIVDTSDSITYSPSSSTAKRGFFTNPSFDIDVVTLPLKYRPAIRNFPNQLSTDFNGAIYLGWRNDIHKIKYKRSLLKSYNREITHYGFTTGVFLGVGATVINPWVTNNAVNYEYDGMVLTTGVAAMFATNSVTLGLGLGIDNLMDGNSRSWVYQNKLWVGLLLGLNIN
jgi:hypothetical protein